VIPQDWRFRRIFGPAWDRVCHYGSQLAELGYFERPDTPNLFVRHYRSISFFADLSGKDEDLPIWTDPRPVLRWRYALGHSASVAARSVNIEAARLAPLPIRLPAHSYSASYEIGFGLDRSLFQRPEPAAVPPASTRIPRPVQDSADEAVDPRTEHVVGAWSNAAKAWHLLCVHCREQVERRWSPHDQRYFFQHVGLPCDPRKTAITSTKATPESAASSTSPREICRVCRKDSVATVICVTGDAFVHPWCSYQKRTPTCSAKCSVEWLEGTGH